MARVTTVVPVYNSAATVRETIASAIAQTYADSEIIAVDDGSTDSSGEILASFGARVRVLTQANRGLSAARNAGVRAGAGELIALLDADDAWQPRFLTELVGALDREGAGAVLAFSDVSIMTSDGAELEPKLAAPRDLQSPSLDQMFEHLCPIMPSAVVMRRAAFEQAGGFCEEFRGLGYEDVYMWLRVRELGSFAHVAEPLVRWRFSLFPAPLKPMRKERAAAVLFESLVQERWHRSARALIRERERSPRSILGYIGLAALARGDRVTARRAFARALRYDPLRIRNYLRFARTVLPGPLAKALSGRGVRA